MKILARQEYTILLIEHDGEVYRRISAKVRDKTGDTKAVTWYKSLAWGGEELMHEFRHGHLMADLDQRLDFVERSFP